MQRHASPIGRKESGLAWDGSSKGTQGIGPPVQRVAQGTQGVGFAKEESSPALPPRKGREK